MYIICIKDLKSISSAKFHLVNSIAKSNGSSFNIITQLKNKTGGTFILFQSKCHITKLNHFTEIYK